MTNKSDGVGFKFPRQLVIIGIILFVVIAGLSLEYSRRKNVAEIKAFFSENVNGTIRKIEKGSGGFNTITTTQGQVLRFCPGDSFFTDKVEKGDSIVKAPFADTLRVYNKNKNLKFAFLKPN